MLPIVTLRTLHIRIHGDIRHIAKIEDRCYQALRNAQFDEIAALRVLRLAKHGDDFAPVKPSRHQMPVVNSIIIGEVVADIASAHPLQA